MLRWAKALMSYFKGQTAAVGQFMTTTLFAIGGFTALTVTKPV